MRQMLEGSAAIARTIAAIAPKVVSAYPITPQTHIVEDLAKLKADGHAHYEYVRAESEFAAASIVAGASATGVRTYTATSSQGLLLMTEVLYNIAGTRLPVVITTANRGVSAPITIWNDHQDAMSIRDAGWIMLFAENHQEAVEQHLIAYRVAEELRLPAMVNIDGYVITHSYEDVALPTREQVRHYLPEFNPPLGEKLDIERPVSFGAFAAPAFYQEIRETLHKDLHRSSHVLLAAYEKLKLAIPAVIKPKEKATRFNNALLEYYGPLNAKTVLIAMGSVVGTIKEVVDEGKDVAVLKIKCFRPFPAADILKHIISAKRVAVLEKAVSLGATDAPLTLEIKAAAKNKLKAVVRGYTIGLGGRDITRKLIRDIIKDTQKDKDVTVFRG